MRAALTYALQDYAGALVLVAHDRHLLKSTVNEFYLVDARKVTKFSGDLDDYQKWLLDLRKQSPVDLDKSKASVKELIKNDSQHNRVKTKQVGLLEKEVNQLQAEKEKIALLLADQEIYQQENRVELEKCLKNSAVLEEKIKVLEKRWFALQNPEL
jgi:ATP-binding cassette subfamily F protein 3